MDQMIGFIGVGNMGSALARAVCKSAGPQAVLLVRFPEQAPEQEVISEEANEAERYQAPDP